MLTVGRTCLGRAATAAPASKPTLAARTQRSGGGRPLWAAGAGGQRTCNSRCDGGSGGAPWRRAGGHDAISGAERAGAGRAPPDRHGCASAGFSCRGRYCLGEGTRHQRGVWAAACNAMALRSAASRANSRSVRQRKERRTRAIRRAASARLPTSGFMRRCYSKACMCLCTSSGCDPLVSLGNSVAASVARGLGLGASSTSCA